MARSNILNHKIFTKIAQKYGRSTGSVALSWAVQRGITVIPKSSSEERIKENISLFVLEDEDMARVNVAHKEIGLHRISDVHGLMWLDLDGVRTLQGWTVQDLGWEDEHGNWLS